MKPLFLITNDDGYQSAGLHHLVRVAEELGALIEKHYHVKVPQAEIEYIALLLESSDDDDLEEKIIILVATHGKATASSMVDVAKRLFSSIRSSALGLPARTWFSSSTKRSSCWR